MNKIPNKIIAFESLNSTSDYLISLYKESNVTQNFIVVTTHQNKGRGRRKKTWFSDNNSLTFSFSFELTDNMNSWILSMAVSLALLRLLLENRVKAIIKYPNDILFKKKKIAGILTESIVVNNRQYCVIGVGLNVNNKMFPKDIMSPISLKQIISKSLNQDSLLRSFFAHLDSIIHNNNLIKDYTRNLYGFNRFIPCLYRDSFLRIKILSVDQNGFLKILTESSSIKTVRHEKISFLTS
tara:strand:- start:3838 stop:4554 length:717 start_codon:yes stop_codon:yes gene_type:complete